VTNAPFRIQYLAFPAGSYYMLYYLGYFSDNNIIPLTAVKSVAKSQI